jgi:hypothetical protein
VDSLDWITRCYEHANRELDTFDRRVALGEHAFAVYVAHTRPANGDGKDGGDDDDGSHRRSSMDRSWSMDDVAETFFTVNGGARDGSPTPASAGDDAHEKGMRDKRIAQIMAMARDQQIRSDFFQRWLRRSLRLREIRRLADVLGQHTACCSLYVTVRTWRAVIQRRQLLRRRAQLLSFTMEKHTQRAFIHRWRVNTLLAFIRRSINQKLYLRTYAALQAHAATRRWTAHGVVADAIHAAVTPVILQRQHSLCGEPEHPAAREAVRVIVSAVWDASARDDAHAEDGWRDPVYLRAVGTIPAGPVKALDTVLRILPTYAASAQRHK